jgi:hypothetical protein
VIGCNTEAQAKESPYTARTAQYNSVITTQIQQFTIKLNTYDAIEDNLSFTIVNEPLTFN